MNLTENEIGLVIIFAVIIAGLVEVIKHFDKKSTLTAKQIDLITMAIGLTMGLGALYATSIELSKAVTLGLGGTFISTRIYEYAKNWLGFNREEEV